MNKNKFHIRFCFIILLSISGTNLAFAQTDSVATRFPVRKTIVDTPEELLQNPPADLRTPSNIKTEVTYDAKNGRYIFQNKIGDKEVGLPFTMTPAEYMKYATKQLNSIYFKERNAIREEKTEPEKKTIFVAEYPSGQRYSGRHLRAGRHPDLHTRLDRA